MNFFHKMQWHIVYPNILKNIKKLPLHLICQVLDNIDLDTAQEIIYWNAELFTKEEQDYLTRQYSFHLRNKDFTRAELYLSI